MGPTFIRFLYLIKKKSTDSVIYQTAPKFTSTFTYEVIFKV